MALFLIAVCALFSGAEGAFAANPFQRGEPNTSISSASAVVQTAQLRAELVAHAPDGVGAGHTVWLGLLLTHQPHWHTYWKNPGDSGLPTQLQWTLPAGAQAADIAWPTPQKIRIGSLANFGYEGTVLLPVPLTLGPDFAPSTFQTTLSVTLHAQWLVCKDTCIPQEGDFALQIPLRSSTALHGADFAAAWAAQATVLPTRAQAQVVSDQLQLRVPGLPAAWQGKQLNLFPETPALVDSPAMPSAEAAPAEGAAGSAPQQWDGAVWRTTLPLSPQRSSSPSAAAWVLQLGDKSVRVEADIQGPWPDSPAPVAAKGVSPALQAALDSNAQVAAQSAAHATGGGNGWWLALALALTGGLILNGMPCVFPVLAIKVLSLAQHSGASRSAQRAQGVAYSAGVVLSFVALGGLMLALRAGGQQLGWGFQLQSPWVISALALLFTLLGLNLMGLLDAGNLLPSGLATLQLRHPLGDAFLTGVLAVAIASPCTAPFMGASLGYAIALPAVQALGIFAALGLGLALPYLLASWFPAVSRCLPRPGAWMETLRRAMAFPMWATVVWLVWVLGHLQGVDGAASLLGLLLCVAMLVWGLQLAGRSRWVVAATALALGVLVAANTGSAIFINEAAATPPAAAAEKAVWQTWTPERVQTELTAGKPVFVDFTAAWCITCQVNKKTTLNQPELLADFAAKHVTLLRADWTHRDPTITQALAQLGRSGVPVYVLYQQGKPPVVLTELLSVGEVRGVLDGV